MYTRPNNRNEQTRIYIKGNKDIMTIDEMILIVKQVEPLRMNCDNCRQDGFLANVDGEIFIHDLDERYYYYEFEYDEIIRDCNICKGAFCLECLETHECLQYQDISEE